MLISLYTLENQTSKYFSKKHFTYIPKQLGYVILLRKHFSNMIDLALWQMISWSCEQKSAVLSQKGGNQKFSNKILLDAEEKIFKNVHNGRRII